MTTAADNLRRWLERVPAVADVLELHPLGALPTDAPLASWPREDVARDAELLRTAVTDTAQEHCDDEGAATSYTLEWKKGERVIGSRRVRFHPTPGSAAPTPAATAIDTNALVLALLKTVTEQQRLMIQSVGAITAAHQSTLTAVTEQVRELVGRVLLAEASGGGVSGSTVDPEERALRLKALGVVVNEGPSILKLIVHGVATKMLGPEVAEAIDDVHDAVEGATKQ